MNGSRDPVRQLLARYRAPSRTADSSMRCAWNTTRRHGLSLDLTSSYPLLATPKTRAYGGRKSTRYVCRTGRLLGRRQRHRSAASCARERFASSYTSISASQKDTSFLPTPPSLRSPATGARGRRRRLPRRRHGGAPPKPGTPPPYAMTAEDLRQVVGEGAMTSLQPLLKEGSYRHDCGVPKYQTIPYHTKSVQADLQTFGFIILI